MGKELSKEESLRDEVENLRKSLEYEKMRSRAFEKMIEIAEKEEGISILKKGGAKQ
jgi:23S rRNA U2552 (ribose-2'-O)-methylase RlmE/FtsJ